MLRSGDFLWLISHVMLAQIFVFILKNGASIRSLALLHLKAIESCVLYFVYLITPVQEATILSGELPVPFQEINVPLLFLIPMLC